MGLIKRIRLWFSIKRDLTLESDAELYEIKALSIDEAYRRVMEIIASYPESFEITQREPMSDFRSGYFDARTEAFFRNFKELYVIESDVKVSLFNDPVFHDGREHRLVARAYADDYSIIIAPSDPLVIEIREGSELERFDSLFHFILVVSL